MFLPVQHESADVYISSRIGSLILAMCLASAHRGRMVHEFGEVRVAIRRSVDLACRALAQARPPAPGSDRSASPLWLAGITPFIIAQNSLGWGSGNMDQHWEHLFG